MKNFIGTFLKKQHFFLIVMCSMCVVRGMEIPFSSLRRSSADDLLPNKKIKIFDPQKLIEKGIKWDDAVPHHLLITPDEKGALIGNPGRIDYISYNNLYDSDPYNLIKHPCAESYTMFAVAQDNEKLLVVSIGNYKDKENNKRISECIISRSVLAPHSGNNSHNVFNSKSLYEREQFDWPVQAMALNSAGTDLVVVHGASVELIDLETWKRRSSNFYPRIAPGIVVVDVAVKPDNEHIAAVSSKGMIDVKHVSGKKEETEFIHLKSVNSGDMETIQEIYFFKNKDLIYVTKDGAVKIIGASDWVENNQGNVRVHTFSHYPCCEKASVDQSLGHAAIHWTENENACRDNRLKMIVLRENGPSVQEFSLKCDQIAKTYNYITNKEQDGSRRMLIIAAALRGKCVLAAFCDGFARLWRLSEKYTEPTEEYARENRHPSPKDLVARQGSFPVINKEDKREKRKNSLINVFKSTKEPKKIEEPKKIDSEVVPSSPRGKRNDNRSASVSPKRKRASVGLPRHAKSDEPAQKNKEVSDSEYNERLRLDILADFTTP